MKGYPHHFQPLFYAIFLTLLFSGIVLIPSALEMRLEWNVPWSLSGELRVGIHALHATGDFLFLFLAGALWSVHMRAGWRRHENHRSGVMLVSLISLLLLSGIGLYYAGEEELGRLAVVVHLFIGLSIPVMLLTHIVGARRAAHRVRHRARRGIVTAEPLHHGTTASSAKAVKAA
jgi:heme A synthase